MKRSVLYGVYSQPCPLTITGEPAFDCLAVVLLVTLYLSSSLKFKTSPKSTFKRLYYFFYKYVTISIYYYARARGDKEKGENGGKPISGYSYTTEGKKICDMQIKEWISSLIEGDFFAYGYYKLAIELRRTYKLIINKKNVYRLCEGMVVLRSQRKIKSKYPRKIARNRVVTTPNQL